MGIKSSFNNFLRETCPNIFEPVHISEYSFMKVAIDISLYMHKFKAVCGDRWLSAFINLIASLRRNEIHCVFIFDGPAPPEKSGEQAKRRDNREKLDLQLYDLEEAVEEYNKSGVVKKCLVDIYAKKSQYVINSVHNFTYHTLIELNLSLKFKKKKVFLKELLNFFLALFQ